MRGNNFRANGASSTDFLLTAAILGIALLLGVPSFRTFQAQQTLGRGDRMLQTLIPRLQTYRQTGDVADQNGQARTIGHTLVIEQGEQDAGFFGACTNEKNVIRAGIARLRYFEADHTVVAEPVSCRNDSNDYVSLSPLVTLSEPTSPLAQRWFFPMLQPSESSLLSEVNQALVKRGGTLPLTNGASATLNVIHASSGLCRSLVFLPDETVGLTVRSQEGCTRDN